MDPLSSALTHTHIHTHIHLRILFLLTCSWPIYELKIVIGHHPFSYEHHQSSHPCNLFGCKIICLLMNIFLNKIYYSATFTQREKIINNNFQVINF